MDGKRLKQYKTSTTRKLEREEKREEGKNIVEEKKIFILEILKLHLALMLR